MFGVWIIAHTTKAGNLQSRAEQMYHRADNTARMLGMALHRLRKFLQFLRTKLGFPDRNSGRNGTMFGVWTMVQVTRLDYLPIRVMR